MAQFYSVLVYIFYSDIFHSQFFFLQHTNALQNIFHSQWFLDWRKEKKCLAEKEFFNRQGALVERNFFLSQHGKQRTAHDFYGSSEKQFFDMLSPIDFNYRDNISGENDKSSISETQLNVLLLICNMLMGSWFSLFLLLFFASEFAKRIKYLNDLYASVQIA